MTVLDDEQDLAHTAFCIQVHRVKHAPRLSSLHGSYSAPVTLLMTTMYQALLT